MKKAEKKLLEREAQAGECVFRSLEQIAKELGYDLWIDGDGAIRFKDEDTFTNLSRMLNDLHEYHTQDDC